MSIDSEVPVSTIFGQTNVAVKILCQDRYLNW